MLSIILIFTLFLSFKISPWPAALMLRYVFEKEAEKANLLLEKHVPEGVSEVLDIPYDLQDKDAYLDIYYPTNNTQHLPLVVWVHGGGWISGDKGQTSNYFKIVASKGYIVASIDYSLAPEENYPTPIKQVMQALKYLQENANTYSIDATSIFLAGDSAGSQIAAQTANIISQPEYASLMHIPPSIAKSSLKGLLLYCGAYDLEGIDMQGEMKFFLNSIMWSYTGKKDFLTNPSFKEASVIHYITEGFPPSFISAGNGDPLLPHSKALAKRLLDNNVVVDTLFFPTDFTPSLPHEYQFNLEEESGKLALKKSIEFMENTLR